MPIDDFTTTPTGMSSADDGTELTYQPAHPRPWETEDPIAYAMTRDAYGEGWIEFAKWKRERSNENAARGGF